MLIDSIQLSMMDVLDISLVALVVYFILRLIRGTHAEQMLIGLFIMLVMYELAKTSGLLTVEWIFDQIFSVFIIILVVLFQAEIRKGLMRVAANPLAFAKTPQKKLIAAVAESTVILLAKGWGGLLVFERETGLQHLDESGVAIHANADAELMATLFSPDTPLHDGALILTLDADGEPKIRSARVILPLTYSKNIAGRLGTRHRAAIGLTEENDALVLVVSEERGDIHLVENGKMSEALSQVALVRALTKGLSTMKFSGSQKL